MLFRKWLLVAFAIRMVRACTYSTWGHADEWFQTLELGHLISHGVATWSQEIALHMRNLTWPSLLALALRAADAIAPTNIHLKIIAAQLLSGVLDLGLVWGWWQMLSTLSSRESLPAWFQNAAMALVILPWCLAANSVSLSAEHISTIAFWVMLGFLTLKSWRIAGFLAVATFAFRYPSGLLSAGAGLAIAIESFRGRDFRGIGNFTLGAVIGIVIFGIPDAVVYGRAWESLWMYLQYNVLTGLGAELFGHQSANVYLEYFRDRWLTSLFPLAVILAGAAALGLYQQLRKWKRPRPWVLALVFYIVGHLLIRHREPRFMAPIELLLLWAAVEGVAKLSQVQRFQATFTSRWTRAGAALMIFINAVMLIGVLWGDTWNKDDQYFQISTILKDTPNACGIISIKRYGSILYPKVAAVPHPAVPIGYLHLDKDGPGFPSTKNDFVVWAERKAKCNLEQSLLIQSHRPDQRWIELGCQQVNAGPYAVLPVGLSETLSHRQVIGGPWYKCPGLVLKKLSSIGVEHPITRRWHRLESLPPPGSVGDDLWKLIEADPHMSRCGWICFRPERSPETQKPK